MSSFESDLKDFAAKVQDRLKGVVTEGAIEVQHSVVEGSEITGAPGQPVDTGTLKGSFIPERINDLEWMISTNLVYAPPIEAGIGPHGSLTLRSKVGGFHSVALTRAGWPRIVETVVPRIAE